MLLATAAFLSAFGFLAWVIGWWAGHPEMAIIGAVVVLGVGVMVTTTGLEFRDGETRIHDNASNTTTIQYDYRTVSTPQHLSLGTLIMLLGGVGVLQSFNRF